MDIFDATETDESLADETAEQRTRRLDWERERIEEALASVAAGRTISSEAVYAWIDSLDTELPLPMPKPGD